MAAASTTFYAIVDLNDPTTIQLAETSAAALLGTALTITARGTGESHTFTKTDTTVLTFNPQAEGLVSLDGDSITFVEPHYLSAGDQVHYDTAGGTGIAVGGTAAVDNDTFYVLLDPVNAYRIQLATTAGGTAADITAFGSGSGHTLTQQGSGVSFGSTINSIVNLDADTIVFDRDPGLATGDKLLYTPPPAPA